jgi:hypothetical protein
MPLHCAADWHFQVLRPDDLRALWKVHKVSGCASNSTPCCLLTAPGIQAQLPTLVDWNLFFNLKNFWGAVFELRASQLLGRCSTT